MKKLFAFFCLLCYTTGFAQVPELPLIENNYQVLTNYAQLSRFVLQLDQISDILTVDTIGKSVQGRNLYALKYSTGQFGKDKSKIKVLIFAQQHGNEQSGKEGALMLALELMKPENSHLFEKIDLALIPQLNPDGSEINKRRNANNIDLNRNHLIITEPEVMALHRFYDKYLFEVNMDVHEYYPYGEAWKNYGYRKNIDVTLGVATNNNISEQIRDYSNQKIVPFLLQQLMEKGFSSFIYCPGGPPGLDYIRHSTFDINDGRQSFGIQGSICFIQEGLNGTDSYSENIIHRAKGQMTGMFFLLSYINTHYKEMKRLVNRERKTILSPKNGGKISVQAKHTASGEKLLLPLYSYFSKTDSVVEVLDYRPVVKSVTDVTMPAGYLIPRKDKELLGWLDRAGLKYNDYVPSGKHSIEQYYISSLGTIDFEGDTVIDPTLKISETAVRAEEFLYVPVNQLKGRMLVLALEPKSMVGLATYKAFDYLVKQGENYPVLRVLKK
jgi:hypothetical protein